MQEQGHMKVRSAAQVLLPRFVLQYLAKARLRLRMLLPPLPQTSRKIRKAPDHSLKAFIAANEYGTYCVPVSSLHRPACRDLIAGKVHEHDTLEFMRANMGSRDLVHAGTFFGDFLPALSLPLGKHNPDACLWGFEPNIESFKCAKITIELNSLDNVTLMNAGLGEYECQVALNTHDESGVCLGGASFLDGEPRREQRGPSKVKRYLVDVVVLDEIIPSTREVGIVQLDVEGFELAALKGAIGIVRRCRPIVILETVPEHIWFKNEILSLGYVLSESVHNNAVFRCPSAS